MKKIITIGIMFYVAILLSIPALSQAPSLPEDNAPIDGGLSLLIAGGIGIGLKKINKRRGQNGWDGTY